VGCRLAETFPACPVSDTAFLTSLLARAVELEIFRTIARCLAVSGPVHSIPRAWHAVRYKQRKGIRMNTSEDSLKPSENTLTDSTAGPGPVHVWLVDDRASLRSLVAESLESRGGIRCTRQFDSPNALLSALASRIGPDVILLDMHMGEFNGIDAIPAIKSLSRATRVLMFTTFYDAESHNRALESGASGFLLKSDPLERIAGSICVTDAGSGELMRAEPVKIHYQKPGGPSVEKSSAPARPKSDRVFHWFKRFGRN
jgi:DNA-binding NarL/FixJ family response regulator